MIESYLTLKSTGKGTFKEKGSKFLAFAFQVATIEDIENRLIEIKKRFHDARHHCYAWRLGVERIEYRANDDGEPTHSAGDPILGQIKSSGITNTLIIVVRYFGGTKLGVGGLINAYKTAAGEAIKSSEIVKIDVKIEVSITYSYEATNEVQRIIDNYRIEIISQEFEDECALHGRVKSPDIEPLKTQFELFQKTGIKARLVII